MKIQKYLIREEAGEDVVHIESPEGQLLTLCGMSLEGVPGDVFGAYDAYEEARSTNKRINCPQCIMIINFCKTVHQNHIQNGL